MKKTKLFNTLDLIYSKNKALFMDKEAFCLNLSYYIKNKENIKESVICVAKKHTSKKARFLKNNMLKNVDKFVNKISYILENLGAYNPQYSKVDIREKNKDREIKIARLFPDRVIILLLYKALKNLLMPTFIPYTYAGIENKGLHKCIKQINRTIRILNKDDKKIFILSADISKFFYKIDNALLLEIFNRHFKLDNLTYKLFTKLLNANAGLPLGNSTSQLLANFYMNYVDYFFIQVKEARVDIPLYYFRYCDNILIFSNNKSMLHYCDKYLQILVKDLHLEFSQKHLIQLKGSTNLKALGFIFNKKVTLIEKKTLSKIVKKRIHENQFKGLFKYTYYPQNREYLSLKERRKRGMLEGRINY